MRIALIILALALPLGFGSAAAEAKTHCAEDMPCFNWSQDGNGQRGIVTMNGTRIVVSVRRFQAMMCRRSPRERGIMAYTPYGAIRRTDRRLVKQACGGTIRYGDRAIAGT